MTRLATRKAASFFVFTSRTLNAKGHAFVSNTVQFSNRLLSIRFIFKNNKRVIIQQRGVEDSAKLSK